MRELVLALAAPGDPLLLRLSGEANEGVLDLERTLEPRLAPDAELGDFADWAAKLTGATARITGLLHLAWTLRTGWAQPVPAGVVNDAARLGHYYLVHALAVFDTMAADAVVDDARAVLDWIIRNGRSRFTRRDAFTALSRARFRKVTDLDPALALLTDHGFVRPGPAPAPTGGRPASQPWDVHPRAAEATEVAQGPLR